MESAEVVDVGNNFIRSNDLLGLQNYYQTLSTPNKNEIEVYGEKLGSKINRVDIGFVFCKLLTNACLHNRYEIVVWLMSLYDTFDIVTKIAVRPTINYSRHLAKTKNYHTLHTYLMTLHQ